MTEPSKILGYLTASRSDVFAASEVLAMLGLEWVLRDPAASAAMATACGTGDHVTRWRVEQPIEGGRIDLVGWAEGEQGPWPAVVVEAKISDRPRADQIAAYAEWQRKLTPGQAGVVRLLLPQSRMSEVFLLAGQLDSAGVEQFDALSWEDVWSALQGADLPGPIRADLDQLVDLYDVSLGENIGPFTAAQVSDCWRDRRDDLLHLADMLSAALHSAYWTARGEVARLYPWWDHRFRYVTVDPRGTCVAIGVFDDELDGFPLAVRYHKDTAEFAEVKHALAESKTPFEHGSTSGSSEHLFVRLHVPPNTGHWDMLDDLERQVRDTVAQGGSTVDLPALFGPTRQAHA